MILIWLLEAIVGLIAALLGSLPFPDLPVSDLSGFFEWVGVGVRVMNEYFPVAILGTCLLIVLVAQFSLFLWNVALSVLHTFWGSR